MSEMKTFFKYVIPSILSFALSGVYAIVDGFFVGHSVGDMGLSAINVAYPVSAVLQAAGTGIGMGGAVYYSISRAEKKENRAREFTAVTLWLLLLFSVILSLLTFFLNRPILQLLGAEGRLLSLGEEYNRIIALGAGLQILSTGLVPFIRNHGGPPLCHDLHGCRVYHQCRPGLPVCLGAGQRPYRRGAGYHYRAGCNAALFSDLLPQRKNASAEGGIREVRLTVKIHYKSRRLSIRPYNDTQYISDHYKPVFYLLRRRSGGCGLCLYRVYYMYRLSDFSGSGRWKPADYQPLLWREEPVLMLILMFTLPPLFGGQIMIWWSTVIARILAAILALILKQTVDRRKLAG